MQPKKLTAPTLAMVQPVTSAEETIYEKLRDQIGERRFENWFAKQTKLTVTADTLVVLVSNPFLLTWLQKQFRNDLRTVAVAMLGDSAEVRFELQAEGCRDAEPGLEATTKTVKGVARKVPASATKVTGGATSRSKSGRSGRSAPDDGEARPFAVRPYADLADFVEGPCNQLAITAAWQVSESSDVQFNPLFIHGNVGIGKSHLLEGICNELRQRGMGRNVVYLTAETFTNHFTHALRNHTLPTFRQRFRSVHALLVDDIDFLDGKRAVQEEFLHTFKQLESQGRVVVVSSDRHPRLLTKVSDELTTRFVSGLVCRLESPNLETRRKIVEYKASRWATEFTPEALGYVAQRFTQNVRELEGALHCLRTYHRMTRKRVGLTAARMALSELERDCIRVVRLCDIEQAVCSLFQVPAEELKSSKRTRSVSFPRMLAMFLARKHTQAAYNEIGQYFGGRNHSTVMSAERKIEQCLRSQAGLKLASEDLPISQIMETLEQQLKTG